MGFIGSGVMARVHMEEWSVTTSPRSSPCLNRPSSAYAADGRAVPAGRREASAQRAGLAAVRRTLRRRARRRVHHHAARLPLRPGDGVSRGRARRPAREADGDDRRRGQALIATRDRTGRLLVVAFQGSLSPQVRTAARMLRSRRARADPQHRRRRLAGLGARAPPARGARTRPCRAAASCSTRAPTC